jgi:diguanylate cyclase (GGDEF)-like protein
MSAFKYKFDSISVNVFLLFCLILTFGTARALSLSEEEKNWIANNPVVEVGIDSNFPPFDFIDTDDVYKGISAEYLDELSNATGLKFNIQPDTWSNTFKKLINNEIDIVTSTANTKERQKSMLFTTSYLSIDSIILVRKDEKDYRSIESLSNKKIAVVKDSAIIRSLLERHPNLNLISYDSVKEGVDAVITGEVTALIGSLGVISYYIEKDLIKILKVTVRLTEYRFNLAIAVNNNKPLLHSILDKALKSIPKEKEKKIRKNWGSLDEDIPEDWYVELSEFEKNWLAQHSEIKLGIDPNWAPIEFFDNKQGYQGITADYIERLSQQLNVSMLAINVSNWAQVLEKARQKEIDMIPALVPSAERAKYLNFTEPYLSFPIVVFIRDDHGLITDINEIKPGLVAVEKSYITEEYMRRDHPELDLLLVNDNKEGLEAVANGQAIAYIGNLASGSYTIEKLGLNNINVGAPTPYRHELTIGVRKDWPELIPILQKALDNIETESHRLIRNKWFPIIHQKPIDYSLIWTIVLIAAFLYAMFFLWFWKTRQQKEMLEIKVRERTKKLTEEIEERNHVESQLRFLANYDVLTRLPNRVLYKEHLDQSIKQAERNKNSVALLLIDIDGFKNINDSLGHHQGDLLLKILAERIKECVRDVDQVARLGGDEFTVILNEVSDKESAATVAKKIIDNISKPVQLDNNKVYVSASLGITLLPDDTNDANTLLGYADMAMYEAKVKGKNAYEFYTSHLSHRVNSRLALEKELHKAIELNQLQLYFQPILNSGDKGLYGAEALLRWEHPTIGPISPVEFIPVAEESGLIDKLGAWVLEEAIKTASEWNSQSEKNIRIAVNISSRQFQKNAFFIDHLEKYLTQYNLNTKLLDFEITESVMMEEQYGIIDKLNYIKQKGISLSIDDFGTGYSSLSYIRRFPIDTIKIDRSFVNDITFDTDDAALITAIIAMAKSLDMNVVAEGVETAEQYRFLQEQNCTFVQGFYFSKALSRKAFEESFFTK